MTKKRFITLLCAILVILAVFTGCASAAQGKSKLQEILDRGRLIVGTGSGNVPSHFMDETGELVGFDIEMARILADALFGDPSKVEFVEESPDSRIPNLLTDKVDIVIQFMTITGPRAQQVTFSTPYYIEGLGLVMPTNGKYKTYDEMAAAIAKGEKVVISALQNVFIDGFVQKLLPGSVCEQYETQALSYQAMDSGRSHGACTDLSSAMWMAKNQPEKYIHSGIAVVPQAYGAAMRHDDQIWINFVNTVFLDAMTGTGYEQYHDAYEKWFGVKLELPKMGRPSYYD